MKGIEDRIKEIISGSVMRLETHGMSHIEIKNLEEIVKAIMGAVKEAGEAGLLCNCERVQG